MCLPPIENRNQINLNVQVKIPFKRENMRIWIIWGRYSLAKDESFCEANNGNCYSLVGTRWKSDVDSITEPSGIFHLEVTMILLSPISSVLVPVPIGLLHSMINLLPSILPTPFDISRIESIQ